LKRALLSVTDKSGIIELAEGLLAIGYELVSTGGTAAALRESGLPVTEVSTLTGLSEMLGGRVKTLHPAIHAGILFDRANPQHQAEMQENDFSSIDVVCINLYEFERTIQGDHRFSDAVESIDIGGPAMIRASAKNSEHVTVVVDPADYQAVLTSLSTHQTIEDRRKLAAKAFRHTAYYDSVIARYLSNEAGVDLSETYTLGLKRISALRYGENPHQKGAVYADPLSREGIALCQLLSGKELSYNNYLDAHAAWELASTLPAGSCVIVKHGNPSGVASHATLVESIQDAKETDPVSAFGGIVAVRGHVDDAVAAELGCAGSFYEVIIAEGFTDSALRYFQSGKGWRTTARLLLAVRSSAKGGLQLRMIGGGALLQDADWDPETEWRVPTNVSPTESQWSALRFCWTVVQFVQSNAIVVGGASSLYGIGAGQMNRVKSVRLALQQAGPRSQGAVLASDAFFPFPDSIEEAAKAGVAAIIQPGGSKKDDEVIAAANHLGIAMVFTGVRHFRH